ncbi:11466_t:CDS:2, partial [Ambispora leptoticha]
GMGKMVLERRWPSRLSDVQAVLLGRMLPSRLPAFKASSRPALAPSSAEWPSRLFYRKLAREWEGRRSHNHIHLRGTINGTTINSGTVGTINGIVSLKRDIHEDYNKVPKRTKIEDRSQPSTPPHQIYSRNAYPPWVQECNNNESCVHDESSDLDNGKNHGEVNNDICNIANEDIYLLSQETPQNVTEGVYKIIEKIESINYRLFDYKTFPSEISQISLINYQVLKTYPKGYLELGIALSLEPSDKSKTIRFEKWKKIINPLVQKYQLPLENKSVFDVISLSDIIEVVLEKPYTGNFIHKEHYDLIWIQDIYKRL